MCLCSFSSKYLTDNCIYHVEYAYFEWKQKFAVFVHVSLNANELVHLAPFSRIDCASIAHTSNTLPKKNMFGFDYFVYRTEIICFKSISV